jgi:hypothetical protein
MTKRSKKAELVQNIKNLGYNYLWDDFVWVLTNHFGFELGNKRGSERAFRSGAVIFIAHEPHKANIFVTKESRKRAIRALKQLEIEREQK